MSLCLFLDSHYISEAVVDWIVFKMSGSSRNSRLIIHSELFFFLGSTVFKGIRFYSSAVRAWRDVTRDCRCVSLPLTMFGWLQLFCFYSDGCHVSALQQSVLPEKAEAGASRSAADCKLSWVKRACITCMTIIDLISNFTVPRPFSKQ